MDTGSRSSNYLLLKIIFKIDLNNVINYHKLSNTSNHVLLYKSSKSVYNWRNYNHRSGSCYGIGLLFSDSSTMVAKEYKP